jgi:hypothetical protein
LRICYRRAAGVALTGGSPGKGAVRQLGGRPVEIADDDALYRVWRFAKMWTRAQNRDDCFDHSGQMALELRITYEGSAPGLVDHRLSLSAFAEALKRLVIAVQRTASALVSPDSADRGAIVAEARLLDVELVGLEHNCVSLRLECVTRPQDSEPPDNLQALAENAVRKLLDDIQAEAKDIQTSPAARRYLHALPGGVDRQRYQALKDGAVLIDFECGAVAFVPEVMLPRLLQIRGSVTGVKFSPVQSVTIKSGERTLHIGTDAAGVEQAFALRGSFVRLAIMMGEESSRLLWIRSDEALGERPGAEETYAFALTSWTRTLDLLAE